MRLRKKLSKDRPVFYPEADFQHVLVWKIHEMCPNYNLRLEKRKILDGKEYYLKAHSD